MSRITDKMAPCFARGMFLLLLLVQSGQCQQCPTGCTCSMYRTTCQGSSASISTIVADISQYTNTLAIFNYMSDLRESDFAQLTSSHLSELHISNGNIQHIYDNAFSTLRFLKSLRLNDNRISSISSKAFNGLDQLKDLDMSRNQIQYFSSIEIFQPLTSLMTLYLTDNKISDLPNGVFSTQSSLRQLDISGNKIGNLRGATFQGARNLQTLHAGRCGIRTLENDIFTKLSAIETLDLSNNEMSNIPSDGNLHMLNNLRNLTLQGNRLTMLTERQFQGLQLNVLDVSKNSLNQIDEKAFAFLAGARYLDLSHNLLRNLKENTFKDIASQLYSLDLSHNMGLVELPATMFSGMVSLQELNISRCGLETIHDQLFDAVFSLRKVDMSNNKLEFLPQSFMNKANSMSTVRLGGNPWHCDCHIRPLRNWLQNPMSISKVGCMNMMGGFQPSCPKPMCATPVSVQYRDIGMLDERDIAKCMEESHSKPPVDIIIGVIVGVLVMIALVILLIVCCYRRHKSGEPLLCTDKEDSEPPVRKAKKREPRKKEYYRETKEKRKLDADIGSLNESDKSFVVRNYFHSMIPDPDALTQGTQSMTRKGSQDSMSQSGYEYGSRHGSRHSSQYSLNEGYKIESAV